MQKGPDLHFDIWNLHLARQPALSAKGERCYKYAACPCFSIALILHQAQDILLVPVSRHVYRR